MIVTGPEVQVRSDGISYNLILSSWHPIISSYLIIVSLYQLSYLIIVSIILLSYLIILAYLIHHLNNCWSTWRWGRLSRRFRRWTCWATNSGGLVIATITNTNTNTILVIIIITSIITIITIITRVRSAWIEVETGTCIQRVELNQSSPLYQVFLILMLTMLGMMIMVVSNSSRAPRFIRLF